jgi:threonyl-tRNA synthetase
MPTRLTPPIQFTEEENATLLASVSASLQSRSEKIGYKIREGQLQKIPYQLVVGDKEVEAGTVAVRHRREGDLGSLGLDEFIAMINHEIRNRIIK